ncbi:hypothetical protein IPP75_04855 [Candidatus Saccharibacteria bacterium]|nr:MAG: hypothetical protein IPP75_04855 [Candidatus Saccharibacteria bacterium]
MTSGPDPHLSDGFRKAGKLAAAGDTAGAQEAAVQAGELLAAETPQDFGIGEALDVLLAAALAAANPSADQDNAPDEIQ